MAWSAPTRTPTLVHFCLQYHTNYGQQIRLVGSHENLGSWQLRDGPDLRWTEGDNWRATVELPAGTVYEYKYVLLDAYSGHALSWQRGNNSVLAIKAGEESVEVIDNWEGQPGAAVVSRGASVTRERALLDWANEMETLVTTQRNDLRRARMELAAATEDAQQSRQELRAARAELARAKAQQATERRKAAELQAANQVLQRHLVETTNSFREALQLVESLMGAEDTLGDDDEGEEEESQLSSGSPVRASEQTFNGAAKQKDADASTTGQESRDERVQMLR
ncbi:g10575 [Coccomyxa elongata]